MNIGSSFVKNGYFYPINLFPNGGFDKIQAGFQQYLHKYGENGKLSSDFRFRVHLVAEWARDLVFNPTLVDAVKDALHDENILCWSTDINAKYKGSPGFYSWHQDSTYSGLEPSDKVLTAWVAISFSNAESGCVKFIPKSHSQQLIHEEVPSASNLLSLGQVIPQNVLDPLLHSEGCVEAELEPGQASLHHWKCVHSSGQNSAQYDRIGFAIRYMTSSVNNTKSVCKERATLVCGDPGSNWELEPDLNTEYGQQEWEDHKLSMKLERQNYFKDSDVKQFK